MTEATLRHLYCERRRSMMEIANVFGTTHAAVLYWLKKYGIARRSWSESTYIKLNPAGDPFTIPRRLTKRQETLLAAGLLLYWAEGKKGGEGVHIGNLDPRLLQLFARFLREVCQIREDRLRVRAQVYHKFSSTAARRYWSRTLRIPPSRVHVYRHTDPRSKFCQQWSPYGIAILEFNSKKLKAWMSEALEQYLERRLWTDPRIRGERPYPRMRAWFGLGRVSDGDGLAETPFQWGLN